MRLRYESNSFEDAFQSQRAHWLSLGIKLRIAAVRSMVRHIAWHMAADQRKQCPRPTCGRTRAERTAAMVFHHHHATKESSQNTFMS
jgi:hypothetical protein